MTRIAFLIYFVACLWDTSSDSSEDARARAPNVSVFSFPNQANPTPTTHTSSREACHSILVEFFLYSSGRGCWAGLVTTHHEACLREACYFKRCSKSLTFGMKRLGHLPRASWAEGYGFSSAPARFWDRGARCFLRRLMLWPNEAAASFGRIDDWGISLQESGTGEIFYAVRSGQFAGSSSFLRLGQL